MVCTSIVNPDSGVIVHHDPYGHRYPEGDGNRPITGWTTLKNGQQRIMRTRLIMTHNELGEAMLVCGQEEPLQENTQLSVFDEQHGVIGLALFTDHRLNRYSFIWIEEPSTAARAVSVVLRQAIADHRDRASWCNVWPYVSVGPSPIRSQWLLKQRKVKGWTTHIEDQLAIATRTVDTAMPELLDPPDYHPGREGGAFVLMGDVPPPEALVKPPFLQSVKLLATSGRFIPSISLLSWLGEQEKEHGLGLAYKHRDDLGRMGVVIISPIHVHTAGLHKAGVIREIREGEQAPAVWRYSPGGSH